MKLRFALDLGTNSLGWAVMRYDGECEEGLDVTEIIDSGVRIFSDGRDRNKEPLNQARRLARGMRKNRRRRNLRVAQTADLLQQAELIPKREGKGIEAEDFAKLCPYQARSDAATEPVDTIVLGRALLHLGKRRGYQSNRREEGDDKEAKANLKRISELRAKLDERSQTLGQYLHEKHQNAIQNHASQAGPEGIRFRGKDGDYSNRAMLKHEFAQIRAIQEPHHQLGTVFWNHLHHAIFDQGKLKPQPRGKCQFLPEFERCHKAVPSYQQFRLLQVLNDLRWVDDNHDKKPLSAEQRQAIYEKLMSQKKVSFAALKKVKHRGRPIFEGITEFSHESEKRKDIEGNETLIEIDKCGAGQA
ncbi:MAG: type II CRISPR RNA-guided endonuclease Cas9, partial [Pseudomonadota bacterium]